MSHPQTVSELFPSQWLHHDDLNGRTFNLTIQRVTFDEFPIKPGDHNGPKATKAILSFTEAQKQLILNKTQCEGIADVAGSEVFKDWIGKRITLTPGRSHNNKPTIKITPPPAPKASDAPVTTAENGDASAQPETEEDFLNV